MKKLILIGAINFIFIQYSMCDSVESKLKESLDMQISEKRNATKLQFKDRRESTLKIDDLIAISEIINNKKFKKTGIDSPIEAKIIIEKKYIENTEIDLIGVGILNHLLLIRIYYNNMNKFEDILIEDKNIVNRFIELRDAAK